MSTVGSHVVPEADLQAALFDIDGTLIDSMPRFFPSWNDAGEAHGITMSEAAFYTYAGMPLPDICRDLYRSHRGGEEPSDEWIAQFMEEKKRAHVAREAVAGTPPAIDAVVARARAHAAAGVPCVAATSGLREHVEAHLAAAGLGDLFPSARIICAADLPKGRGKPKPDIFLRAAALVGADPARCVAYEDAEAGLEAAWRAGCHVVDVTDYPGYPLPDGLAKAKVQQRAARAWLVEPADAGCGCGPLC